MKELIIGLILTAISGLSFLAWNSPEEYKKLVNSSLLLVTLASLAIIYFGFRTKLVIAKDILTA